MGTCIEKCACDYNTDALALDGSGIDFDQDGNHDLAYVSEDFMGFPEPFLATEGGSYCDEGGSGSGNRIATMANFGISEFCSIDTAFDFVPGSENIGTYFTYSGGNPGDIFIVRAFNGRKYYKLQLIEVNSGEVQFKWAEIAPPDCQTCAPGQAGLKSCDQGQPACGWTPTRTINVDGNPVDWVGLIPAIIDPSSDNNSGGASYDLKSVYTAIDDMYAYVMVSTYGTQIPQEASVEVNFDYKPGQHIMHGNEAFADIHTNIRPIDNTFVAWTDDDLDGILEEFPISGYSIANGSVLELRIPLSGLENSEYFNPTFINIWQPGMGQPGNDPTDICID